MNAQKILDIVPNDILDKIALDTGVDDFVKKLKGKLIFKLFIYAILSHRAVSLRILEAVFISDKFRNLFNDGNKEKIKHNSISSRLAVIDHNYFKEIFNYLINSKKVSYVLFDKRKINLRKIDSTVVTLSSKLLKFGKQNQGKSEIKYSVEINQGIPVNILFFKDKSYVSEDIALPELLKTKSIKDHKTNIFIFDRGIQKRTTFTTLAKNNIYFVSRLTSQKYMIVDEFTVIENKTPSLEIISDQLIKFKNNKEIIDQELRLITANVASDGNGDKKVTMSFITNITFLDAKEITELYKSRWEIETFFKFIKQELNFSHLISRNENGIKSIMYLTMITAILLTIYKTKNPKPISWMVAKIKFIDEIESHFIKELHKKIPKSLQPPNFLYS